MMIVHVLNLLAFLFLRCGFGRPKLLHMAETCQDTDLDCIVFTKQNGDNAKQSMGNSPLFCTLWDPRGPQIAEKNNKMDRLQKKDKKLSWPRHKSAVECTKYIDKNTIMLERILI